MILWGYVEHFVLKCHTGTHEAHGNVTAGTAVPGVEGLSRPGARLRGRCGALTHCRASGLAVRPREARLGCQHSWGAFSAGHCPPGLRGFWLPSRTFRVSVRSNTPVCVDRTPTGCPWAQQGEGAGGLRVSVPPRGTCGGSQAWQGGTGHVHDDRGSWDVRR